jgi:hypothetical protein
LEEKNLRQEEEKKKKEGRKKRRKRKQKRVCWHKGQVEREAAASKAWVCAEGAVSEVRGGLAGL